MLKLCSCRPRRTKRKRIDEIQPNELYLFLSFVSEKKFHSELNVNAERVYVALCYAQLPVNFSLSH